MWRQGDVLIREVESIPRAAIKRSDRVLVEGTVTGHRHEISPKADAALFELEGAVYLRVFGKRADVIHAEHGTITLQKGMYFIWRQREYVGQGRIQPVLD